MPLLAERVSLIDSENAGSSYGAFLAPLGHIAARLHAIGDQARGGDEAGLDGDAQFARIVELVGEKTCR